tara:strand:+ start:5802 stop:6653 length:852 start_codon:yes stop_codon:yes gene_type:complete
LKAQNNRNLITAIILTYNEEVHIRRCIKSIKNFTNEIIIIDSFSKDQTLKECKKFKNIKIFQRKFIHQANQMNWALKNLNIKNRWILRIDADEYITNFNQKFFFGKLSKNKKTNGFIFIRKIKFLGKVINHGLTSPHKTIRIWRNRKGRYPNISMDEQVIVKGKVDLLDSIIIDHNKKGFLFWLKKHLNYAKKETNEYFKRNKYSFKSKNISDRNKLKKYKSYYNFPIFIRPIILFIYSYIYKLGFLSGVRGFLYYLVQNFLYRLIVDIFILRKKITFLLKKN